MRKVNTFTQKEFDELVLGVMAGKMMLCLIMDEPEVLIGFNAFDDFPFAVMFWIVSTEEDIAQLNHKEKTMIRKAAASLANDLSEAWERSATSGAISE